MKTVTHFYISQYIGNENIIKLLLKHDSTDVNILNEIGESPLHWAAQFGSTEMVELPIDNNAKVKITNNDDESLLHCAIFYVGFGVVVVTVLLHIPCN